MSNILHYPDAMNAPELQVWNNAAFDNEESDGRWSACLEPDSAFVNRSSDSDFGKENLSPGVSVSVKSSVSTKPLRSNTAILNSDSKPTKLREEELEEEEKRIDSEIEEIEKEISRLSSRLEALRIEKAGRKSKAIERRGRIVPAKFLEPTPKKKVEENPKSFNRRGLSLGPSEILAGAGFRRLSKLEVTPVQSAQNRRKSCFWKLQEIDELRATKERGKSQSLSPKSRKTVLKTQPPKQPVTTSRRMAAEKKEEASIASTIQPKKLFGGEKSSKKPVRQGRVVASRYNSSAVIRTSNEARKRSLPEEEEEEVKRCEKKRLSSVAGKSAGGGRGKKKWEIPTEVVVFRGSPEEEEDEEESSVAVLPKIRTLRCVAGESPGRDSGPAKRVAELVGRRSYFCTDEEEQPVCQALSFGEEEEERR